LTTIHNEKINEERGERKRKRGERERERVMEVSQFFIFEVYFQ
jgi:hypothetical protein